VPISKYGKLNRHSTPVLYSRPREMLGTVARTSIPRASRTTSSSQRVLIWGPFCGPAHSLLFSAVPGSLCSVSAELEQGDTLLRVVCHVFRGTAKPGHVECRFSGTRESGGFWGRAESRIGRVLRSGKWFWQGGLRSAGLLGHRRSCIYT
jgi:hypothetical protein